MVTSTPEKPRMISFETLSALKDELTKQSENRERLKVFQAAIDQAIEKDGEKSGVIEFTEKEWRDLITNENLPPLEEVKALLEKKIEWMREVQSTSRESREGIMGELDKKVDEVKSTVTEAVDEVKEKGQAAITEALSPLQKIKESFVAVGTKMGEFFSEIGSTIKFLFFTLGAALGFKWAKEVLTAMTKEKAEKIIAEWKEKAKEEVAEAKEGLIEKTAPLAILGWAGLGIFNLIKNKLPLSLQQSLEGVKGTELLKKLATSRALRLFGIGGIGIFWIGRLYEYIENNGASLGEMPADEAGKKSWWKNALEKAGIGIKEGSEDIWAVLSGGKVEEYFDKRWTRPGYKFLEDSRLLADVKSKIKLLGDKLELIYKKNPEAFQASIGLLIGGNIATKWLLFSPAMKWVDLVRIVMGALYKSAKNHPLLWGIEIALLGTQMELIKHIQIPENMTTEDIGEMLSDMADIGEIGAKLEEITPWYKAKEHIHTVTEYLDNNGEKLTAEIDGLINNWQEKLEEGSREFLVQDANEKIGSKNKIGLQAFQAELTVDMQEKMKWETAPALVGEDEKGGILQEIIDKTHRSEPITEADIYRLMKATEGTKIRIFPEWGEKDGRYIQWAWVDENGTPDMPAKNICINPLLEQDEKLELAEDFIYDPSSLGFWWKLWKEAYSDVRSAISEVAEKATSNPGETKNAVERVIGAGGAILKIGGKTAIEYLDQVYILGPSRLFETLLPGGKQLSGQEFLVEYAGGIMPVLVVTAVKRAVLKQGMWILWWRLLAETASYPIKLPIDAGKFIFKKWEAGKLWEILDDPFVAIKDGLYQRAGKLWLGWSNMKEVADNITLKEKIKKIKHEVEKIKKYKKAIVNGTEKTQEIIKEAQRLTGKSGSTIDLDDILRGLDEEITKVEGKIQLLRGTVTKELREKIKTNPKALTEADIPAKKWDLLAAQKTIEARIAELETAKQQALAKHAAGNMTDAEWNSARRNFARRTTQLEAFNARIRTHLDLHPTHPEGKWKWRARGIIWVATLALVMVWVSKLRADDPSMEIPELNGIESEVNFFGFSETEKETSESESAEKKNEENNEIKTAEAPEYIQPFLANMSDIQWMYGTEFEFLGNPEALTEASDEKIEQKIEDVKKIHSQMIVDIKKVIRENKEQIKKYFREEHKETIGIKKQNLNAFFALTEDNGEISLDYMDETDFSVTIWDLVDFNRDNAENLLDGSYNQWWDAGSYMIPLYGTWRDGKSTWRNFGRGHIKQWFKSLGWTVFWGVCDVATVVSLGSTSPLTAGGKAVIRWVGSGLRMARMGKILAVMQKIRGISAGRIAGNLLWKWMNTALTHSGKFMLGGMWADAAHQLIEFPRSESINIDKL